MGYDVEKWLMKKRNFKTAEWLNCKVPVATEFRITVPPLVPYTLHYVPQTLHKRIVFRKRHKLFETKNANRYTTRALTIVQRGRNLDLKNTRLYLLKQALNAMRRPLWDQADLVSVLK